MARQLDEPELVASCLDDSEVLWCNSSVAERTEFVRELFQRLERAGHRHRDFSRANSSTIDGLNRFDRAFGAAGADDRYDADFDDGT